MHQRDLDRLRSRQARWLRPDAHRWLRPDAERWLKPLRPEEQKYNPAQPRVPAGNPDGGQWTSEGGDFGRPVVVDLQKPRGIDDPRVLSDADFERVIPGAQYAQNLADVITTRGGHHIVPQSLYEHWSEDARRVFNAHRIGPIDNKLILQTEPGGNLVRHVYDKAHRLYNLAVADVSERFFREKNIDPKRMSSAHALELRARVDTSPDPRIRDFNSQMRLLARVTRVMRNFRGE